MGRGFIFFGFLISLLMIQAQALAGQMILEQAFEKALAGNPTLQAMAQRINQAQERVVQAKAAYLPQVALGGSLTRHQMSDNDQALTPIPQSSWEIYEGSMSAKWVLFDGFSTQYRHQAALLGQDLAEAGRADLMRKLLYSVATGFHSAQLALANQAIAESNKTFYARQLEDARIKKEAGKGSLTDVLNFNTRMNQAQVEMEKYAAQYDVARAGLAALLGADAQNQELPEPVFPAQETPGEMELPDAAVMTAHALDHRPDVNQLKLAISQAQAQIGAAKARFFPEISLNGSVGADKTNNARFESDDLENRVGLQVSYPLFSGGRDGAALKEAHYAEAEALLDLKNLENMVVSEIQQDCFTIASVQKQLRLYRENAALAEQNRDMVAIEYQYGKTSLVSLNEVQNTLTETQQKIALALVSLRQAWVDLRSSAGSLAMETN